MDLEPTPPKQTGYRTWEGFETGQQTTAVASNLGEAGAGAYDALLAWSVDPLKLKNVDVPAVDEKAYFSSLLSLALGRESLFYVRDGEAASFKSVLPKMRISGFSREVLRGVESQCLSCGSMMLELRKFTQAAYARQAGQCRIALASATSEVLQVIQNYVALDTPPPRSVLQLQATVKRVAAILTPLARLHTQMRSSMTDNDILSLVHRHASLADVNETFVRGMMRELLSRVSTPWLDFFHEWIGLKHEVGPPLLASSLGVSKWFVTVKAEVYVDDFGREVEDVGFRLDRKGMPPFVTDDLAHSIFETGRNMRFIRTFHPQHALAQPSVLSWSNLPRAKWLFDWDSVERLESRVAEYQNRLTAAIETSGTGGRERHLYYDDARSDLPEPPSLQFFGLSEQEMESRIETSIQRLNQPLRLTSSTDPIANIVQDHLHAKESEATHDAFTPHWSLLPLLSFGSLAAAQAKIVNRETLKLLFKEHDLLGHLDLQREFHLLGNGLFCNHLSHALFDPDLESAERQAGVAREGGVMGLRLEGRDTWPPASSELRLALMGVLTESYSRRNGDSSQSTESLPGDLSFAVRDLSEEEIDKCMDPSSLEALDFLRLSYTTPPELLPMITPLILLQYDQIFKVLLRVLRMMYVTNQLFRDSHWTMRFHGYELRDEEYRFVREAHNFVSSVAAYFLGTGITTPWDAFSTKLSEIERSLYKSNSTEEVPSPAQLCEMHSKVLNRIMSALFLRKRQQPVLALVEDIFNIILKYAKISRSAEAGTLDHEQEVSQLYHDFKKRVQQFITVCRGLTEKVHAESKENDGLLSFGQSGGLGDESMIAQLLSKLDLNNYYVK